MPDDDYEIQIKMDMSQATSDLMNYMTTLRSFLRLAKRMGLPEEVRQQITTMQRLMTIAYQLRVAYLALAAAESLTTMGAIRGGIALGGAVLTAVSLT